MRETVSGLLTLVLLAGCAGGMPTGPSTADVALDVEWGTTIEGDVTVTATVTNVSDRTLGMRCPGIWLQVQTADGWALSKSVSCIGVGPLPFEPGASRGVDYEVARGQRYRVAVQVSEPDGTNTVMVYSEPSDADD